MFQQQGYYEIHTGFVYHYMEHIPMGLLEVNRNPYF